MWQDDICNSSLVYNMSRACVLDKCDGGDDYGDMCGEVESGKCYPYSDAFSIFVSCWCIFIAVVGTCTNLLTLCAIPSAIRSKRFGLANIAGGTTTFIINLALADLLYCMFSLPLYATTYLYEGWPLGQPFCIISAAFRDANAFAEWMALATVAFSRYAGLVWKDWASKYLKGTRGFLLAVATWIWAYSLMLFSFIGENETGGYDCRSARCSIQGYEKVFDVFQFCILFASLIPCIVIFTCYTLIFVHVKKSYKHLRCSSPFCKNHKQEMNLTRATTIVTLCFIFCVGPMTMWNMLDRSNLNPNIGLGLYCVYWIQYCINFFIYAFQSSQFRRAYIEFLRKPWKALRCFKKDCIGEPASTPYQTVLKIVVKRPHFNPPRMKGISN